MKRFTSEELVLRLGAVAEEKGPDQDPDTVATCHCCIKPITAKPKPKPSKKRDALAFERGLNVLQRQMAGILGS